MVLEVSIDGIDLWSYAGEEMIQCEPMAATSSTSLIPVAAGVHDLSLAVPSICGRQIVSFT